MEATIYNSKGKEAGKINLPTNIFGVKWNADLVHQTIASLITDSRVPYAHTKDRGEVRGGGKKPWKQKGTGRARHGSTRSPIWVGGGVAHGPRNEKNFDRKVNKKAKAKTLATILSAKFNDGEILFVESLTFSAPKTKEAKEVIKNLSSVSGFAPLATKKKNAAFVLTSSKDKNVEKSFSNFGNMDVKELRNVSPTDLLSKKFLIIESPEKALKILTERISN